MVHVKPVMVHVCHSLVWQEVVVMGDHECRAMDIMRPSCMACAHVKPKL